MRVTRDERIQQLKDTCDSIKENAADYIGESEFRIDVCVSIIFEPDSIPVVEVKRRQYPEKLIKRLVNPGGDAM